MDDDDDDISGPPRLPPELHNKIDHALSDVYRQAFDLFRASDPSSPSAEISQRTAESILLRVHDFVSNAQQADNARLSQQNHLPIELWCSVWRHLPFLDLIFSTRVCREWRTAALNDPTLWQHVEFYTTRHYFLCECTSCGHRSWQGLSHAPGWEETFYREDATNITYLDCKILLARSRGLPLHVTVIVVPCHEAGDMSYLRDVLFREHAQRLCGITMFSADPDAPLDLLRECTALPRLRYLFFLELPVQGRRRGHRERRFPKPMPSGLALPLLDELGLASRFLAPAPGHELPSVRALTVQPTNLDTDLRLALAACPDAAQVTLDLAFADDPGAAPEDPAWWRARTAAPALRSVSATGVPASCAAWLRAACAPALPTLTLSYTDPRKLAAGGAILADLGSDIRLSVMVSPQESGDFLVVRGTDGDARARQVSLRMGRAGPSREILSRIVSPDMDNLWRNITAITARATLLPLVVSVFPVPGAAEVRSLCIAMDVVAPEPALPFSPWQDGSFYEPELSLPPDGFALPALRSLVLKRGPGSSSLSTDDIDAFVRGLRVPLPLEVLELDRRVIAGDASALNDLAESVTVV